MRRPEFLSPSESFQCVHSWEFSVVNGKSNAGSAHSFETCEIYKMGEGVTRNQTDKNVCPTRLPDELRQVHAPCDRIRHLAVRERVMDGHRDEIARLEIKIGIGDPHPDDGVKLQDFIILAAVKIGGKFSSGHPPEAIVLKTKNCESRDHRALITPSPPPWMREKKLRLPMKSPFALRSSTLLSGPRVSEVTVTTMA